MLDQRRTWWVIINPTLGKYLAFSGILLATHLAHASQSAWWETNLNAPIPNNNEMTIWF